MATSKNQLTVNVTKSSADLLQLRCGNGLPGPGDLRFLGPWRCYRRLDQHGLCTDHLHSNTLFRFEFGILSECLILGVKYMQWPGSSWFNFTSWYWQNPSKATWPFCTMCHEPFDVLEAEAIRSRDQRRLVTIGLGVSAEHQNKQLMKSLGSTFCFARNGKDDFQSIPIPCVPRCAAQRLELSTNQWIHLWFPFRYEFVATHISTLPKASGLNYSAGLSDA